MSRTSELMKAHDRIVRDLQHTIDGLEQTILQYRRMVEEGQKELRLLRLENSRLRNEHTP
jgi:hypothetical protein